MIVDALRMIQDIRRTSRAVDVWGALLNIPQFVGGLIFIAQLEGRLILITLIFTLLVAGQIHRVSPFSRLIGLCHLPWLVLLPIIASKLSSAAPLGWYEGWLAYVFIVICISLVFDAWDVARYLRGDKKFAWASDLNSARRNLKQ